MAAETVTQEAPANPVSTQFNHADPTIFTEYLMSYDPSNIGQRQPLKNSLIPKSTQYLTLASFPTTPIYTIKTHHAVHSKPDVQLYLGPDLHSPLLAVGRLNIKNHSFGISTPDQSTSDERDRQVLTKDGRGEEFMTWESLKQITRWSKKVYGFEWGVGHERKKYTWLRTKGTGVIKEMELREGGREEAENGSGVLARWVKGSGVLRQKEGRFLVREEGMEGWEAVVLVTFLMVLEIVVRDG